MQQVVRPKLETRKTGRGPQKADALPARTIRRNRSREEHIGERSMDEGLMIDECWMMEQEHE